MNFYIYSLLISSPVLKVDGSGEYTTVNVLNTTELSLKMVKSTFYVTYILPQ